jgi:hypothetical protein
MLISSQYIETSMVGFWVLVKNIMKKQHCWWDILMHIGGFKFFKA